MNAQEHVAWAKHRALEYIDLNDPVNALASLTSDLRKHPDTAEHAGIELGMTLALAGHLHTTAQVREWIEGIN
jgi:hypothetical protein